MMIVYIITLLPLMIGIMIVMMKDTLENVELTEEVIDTQKNLVISSKELLSKTKLGYISSTFYIHWTSIISDLLLLLFVIIIYSIAILDSYIELSNLTVIPVFLLSISFILDLSLSFTGMLIQVSTRRYIDTISILTKAAAVSCFTYAFLVYVNSILA